MRTPSALATLLLLVATGCGLLPPSSTGVEETTPFSTATIEWDDWAVPHIRADDEASMYRAFGWAQMHSHGNLLLNLYGEARGRAAEYWGAQFLDSDRWVRTMGIPERAEEWYRSQPADFRQLLDAFVDGLNSYAAHHTERLEPRLSRVLPITPADVLAHGQRVIQFTLTANQQMLLGGAAQHLESTGSCAWAVAPSRSASGNSLLMINPHLPWRSLFMQYEAHLRCPGGSLYGATFVGFPVITQGFNDALGWAHTVGPHDSVDLYELELDGDGYLMDGEHRAFDLATLALWVLKPDGTLEKSSLARVSSEHGPVLSAIDRRAIAVRVAGLDRGRAFEQWWRMGRSQNLPEFEASLALLQIPTFTTTYADRDGHILHFHGGVIPRRPIDVMGWGGVVQGNVSRTKWDGILEYGELPRLVDPASGFLQNANDAPWYATLPPELDPADYPAQLAPVSIPLRAQRALRALSEDSQITLDELIALKHSTESEAAVRLVDDLIQIGERSGKELAEQAAAVLSRWDRRFAPDSTGALLFQGFLGHYWGQGCGYATPWDPGRPLDTPAGIAEPLVAIRMLETAAVEIRQRFGGGLEIPWGEIHRFRGGSTDLAGNGGHGDLGILRVVGYAPAADGKYQAVGGDSFIAAVEFGERPRAMVLLTYGNATQAAAQPVHSSLELAARNELRPALLDDEAIAAHRVLRESIPTGPPDPVGVAELR